MTICPVGLCSHNHFRHWSFHRRWWGRQPLIIRPFLAHLGATDEIQEGLILKKQQNPLHACALKTLPPNQPFLKGHVLFWLSGDGRRKDFSRMSCFTPWEEDAAHAQTKGTFKPPRSGIELWLALLVSHWQQHDQLQYQLELMHKLIKLVNNGET